MRAWRRFVWTVNGVGFWFTLSGIVASAGSVGTVVAVVVKGVYSLSLPWIVALGVALSILAAGVLGVAVAGVLRQGLYISQQADSGWITATPNDGTVLTASCLVANAGDESAFPVEMRTLWLRTDGTKKRLKLIGRFARFQAASQQAPLDPGGTESLSVTILAGEQPEWRRVTAKVELKDQKQRKHRGRLDFWKVEPGALPPTAA